MMMMSPGVSCDLMDVDDDEYIPWRALSNGAPTMILPHICYILKIISTLNTSYLIFSKYNIGFGRSIKRNDANRTTVSLSVFFHHFSEILKYLFTILFVYTV